VTVKILWGVQVSSKFKNSSIIHGHNICGTAAMTLTWHGIHKWIEESNYEVDKHRTVEEYVAPQ
jgi:hypothetical protein